MNRTTKKSMDYLKRYIGQEIIRTCPAGHDWSYTNCTIILDGFTPNGCIMYHHTNVEKKMYGDEEFVLSSRFTDRKWIPYSKVLRAKRNKLNKWRGKRIRRNCPTPKTGDCSFTEKGKEPTLISATRHHIVIMLNHEGYEGDIEILNSNYVKPNEWELAE